MLPILAAVVVAWPPGAADIARIHWEQTPTGEDLARNFPISAMMHDIQGQATIACVIADKGTLTDCTVKEEYPLGEGFGDAAMKNSSLFRLRVASPAEAENIGRLVRIPIRFDLPGSNLNKNPSIDGAAACYGQITHVIAHDQQNGVAWKSSLYWLVQLGAAIANAHGTPAFVDSEAKRARETGEDGTLKVPAGYELATCMTKAGGK